MTERQGLAVARALGASDEARDRLRAALDAARVTTADEEIEALSAAVERERDLMAPLLTNPKRATPQSAPQSGAAQGIAIKAREGHVVLSGQGVDAVFLADLQAWLATR